MTCELTKIDSIPSEQADNLVICEARKLLAYTTPDLKLKVFSYAENLAEPSLVREFKHHVGAILSVVFAPLTHHTYILTIGYDKTLHLYNLDDPKLIDPVFSYTEDKEGIGYFTSAAFIPSEKSRLIFLIGSSAGYLLTFDSQSHFDCKYKEIATGQVKSISANEEGDVAVVTAGAVPQIFIGFDFENGCEFSQNGQNLLKTTQVCFSGDFRTEDKSLLLTVSEDQTVGIWELSQNLKIITHLQKKDFKTNVLTVNWNLGALSFNVFCGKKEEKLSDLKVFKVSSPIGGEHTDWKVTQLEIKND